MPIPTPKGTEARKDFVSRCVGFLRSEGKDAAQAVAICNAQWEDSKGNHAMDYSQLNGVEIFKVGTHNGDAYTSEDIDDIVDAFNALDYQPALKLGHDKSPGAPAIGYISKLWRKGDTLMANFSDIPEKIFAAIKDKMFNRVSAEIWFNLERAGKKYRRALKALALLGAEVPAVAGLKPLADLFSDFHGDLHETEEFAFSTDEALRAASAANKQGGSNHGDKSMSGKDTKDKSNDEQLAEVLQKFEALQKHSEEEKGKREAAEAKLAELQAKIDKQSKGGGGDDDKSLAERISKMSQDQKSQTIAELSDKLEAALSAGKAEREARELAEKRAETLEDRTKKLEESQRKDRLDKLADKCVIPSLRPFVRQFSDLATRGSDLRVYNEDTAKLESALDAVERFINFVNHNSKRLFSVISNERTDHSQYDGSASDEVDRRVKKYMDEHKDVSYKTAMERVLDADEQLKQDYVAAG